ncbi:hypothetical protein PUN28_020930 [Cardiocondyla obscurior]|uniref:Uncharacterized protein n=1 Tax=Cardiocondyla obscurior TaxID=286306 RepID=A0AAW2E7N0_9HYME
MLLNSKIFFRFSAISRLLVKIKARNRPVCIFFNCRTMLCCQIKKIFFVFCLFRLLKARISPYASIFSCAQCYVAKFQKFFCFFGHISSAGENRRLGINPYAFF